jgi:hypothetical protein
LPIHLNDGKEVTAVRVVRVNNERFGVPSQERLDDAGSPDELGAADTLPQYPIVLVTWHDAWFDFDQQDPEDCRADYLVRTVGFLVDDGPRFVSVAQEVLPDGDGFRAVTHIPRSIIEHVMDLGELVETLEEPAVTVEANGGVYTSAVVENEFRKEG